MQNESSYMMTKRKRNTPLFWMRFTVFLWFIGYFIATSNVSSGLIAYYLESVPNLGRVLSAFLPIGFVLSAGWLVYARDEYPSWSFRVAGIPQYIYMAYSIGWFIGDPTLSFVAVTQHLGTTFAILLFAWAEDYYGTRTD